MRRGRPARAPRVRGPRTRCRGPARCGRSGRGGRARSRRRPRSRRRAGSPGGRTRPRPAGPHGLARRARGRPVRRGRRSGSARDRRCRPDRSRAWRASYGWRGGPGPCPTARRRSVSAPHHGPLRHAIHSHRPEEGGDVSERDASRGRRYRRRGAACCVRRLFFAGVVERRHADHRGGDERGGAGLDGRRRRHQRRRHDRRNRWRDQRRRRVVRGRRGPRGADGRAPRRHDAPRWRAPPAARSTRRSTTRSSTGSSTTRSMTACSRSSRPAARTASRSSPTSPRRSRRRRTTARPMSSSSARASSSPTARRSTPKDVVASFQRIFKVKSPTAGGFYAGIVGADKCLETPATCTLEGGVSATRRPARSPSTSRSRTRVPLQARRPACLDPAGRLADQGRRHRAAPRAPAPTCSRATIPTSS